MGQLGHVVVVRVASSADLAWYSMVAKLEPHAVQDAIVLTVKLATTLLRTYVNSYEIYV